MAINPLHPIAELVFPYLEKPEDADEELIAATEHKFKNPDIPWDVQKKLNKLFDSIQGRHFTRIRQRQLESGIRLAFGDLAESVTLSENEYEPGQFRVCITPSEKWRVNWARLSITL